MPEFSPKTPVEWEGRYARIPGVTTVVHIRRSTGGWCAVVDWAAGDETAVCALRDSDAARVLCDAVNAGKRELTSRDGGSFLINEFGQVLVPAAESEVTHVALVGEWTGPLDFNNPFEPGTTFDFASSDGLEHGDEWNRPYVGIPHNLSRADELYFRSVSQHGTEILKPPVQDDELVAALRALRPSRPVRFIVTPGGLVVTKVEIETDTWEPFYVGQIDYDRWFGKEAP